MPPRSTPARTIDHERARRSSRRAVSAPPPTTSGPDCYAQFARHMRLQPPRMGALAMSQAAAVSIPEQSNEPDPGAGDTHEGGGGRTCKQRSEASEYSVPSGQAPASSGGPAAHPQAGVRQISEGEQSASPQAKSPPSVKAASPAAWSELPPESRAEPLSERDSPPDEEDAASFVPASPLSVPLFEPELPQPAERPTTAARPTITRSVRGSANPCLVASRPEDSRRTAKVGALHEGRTSCRRSEQAPGRAVARWRGKVLAGVVS
jgi:hypothetical protein